MRVVIYFINMSIFEKINNNMKSITDYITEVKTTLDKAVHGHDKAKKQIERIIGQWINGEQNGYCFGFEGPPGLGKTSLAKALSTVASTACFDKNPQSKERGITLDLGK
jgi:ATP-dependent Lon protease